MANGSRPLAGRVAWVTGGTSGIGLAIATELARQGADIATGGLPLPAGLPAGAYADRPDDGFARIARDRVEAEGVRIFTSPFDVRSADSLAAFLADATAVLGRPTFLVNAAGVSAQQTMLEARDDTWHGVLDINLSGAFRCTRLFLAAIAPGARGRIVNIGSTASSVGYAGYAAYCASKHGLAGLTRAVAAETAGQGVTCNLIEPGYVATGMMRMGSEIRAGAAGQGTSADDDMWRIAQANPQRRLVTPEEVAALVAFLCSNVAAGITGQSIRLAAGANW